MSESFFSTTKDITIDPLRASIHIIITNNPNKVVDDMGVRAWVSDDPEEDLSRDSDALFFAVKVSDYYILLSPEVDVDVVAHECVHCIARIFEHRGEKADYDNTEVFAYHVGWLTKIAYEHLKGCK